MLTGQAVFLAGRAPEAGRVLQIPTERLKRVVAEEPALSDLIMRAFLARRELLIGRAAATLKIIGSRFSPDTLRLRAFAARSQLPFRWVDLEADEEAAALVEEFQIAPEETPVVIWQGTEVLRNPSLGALARRIGLSAGAQPGETYDLTSSARGRRAWPPASTALRKA